MNYCRFSTDDFQCDIYCYEDASGGYATHVACNRVIFKDRLPDRVPFDNEHALEWVARHKKVIEMLKNADRVPIGLRYDGMSFWDGTEEELLARLIKLRDVGYRFPDSVLNVVSNNIA